MRWSPRKREFGVALLFAAIAPYPPPFPLPLALPFSLPPDGPPPLTPGLDAPTAPCGFASVFLPGPIASLTSSAQRFFAAGEAGAGEAATAAIRNDAHPHRIQPAP